MDPSAKTFCFLLPADVFRDIACPVSEFITALNLSYQMSLDQIKIFITRIEPTPVAFTVTH